MKKTKRLLSLFLALVLIISTFGIIQVNAATDDTRYSKKYLQNGGFEENASKYSYSSNYAQPVKTSVPYWDTTAFGSNSNGTQGKLEFFKAGAAHFNQSSTNKVVAEGEIAAELNADEVSTIYQRIETVSGSTYTWGLDHRGRDTTDTMVLFIGPEQYDADGTTAIDPSKPSKTGQDQFVKMTDWLKTQYGVTYPATGCSQKYTVYSKPFAEKGAFQNESTNANENFSMTPTDECTEEWSCWVISSVNNNTSTDTNVAVKGWSKYGTNCYGESEDSYSDVIKGVTSKLGYDCTYTVPKGQTKTLFAFTSYSGAKKSGNNYVYDATYGNLLDDINFKLYQPLSVSITDGGIAGTSTSSTVIADDITVGNAMSTTVEDGTLCTIYTSRYNGGHFTDCDFSGAIVTISNADGTVERKYVEIYEGDVSNLSDEEKLELSKDYFLPSYNDGENTWDYYYNVSVESAVNVHLIYTKAPFVMYDSNGGLPYQFLADYSDGGNLVGFGDSFQTVDGVDTSDYYYDYQTNGEEVILGKYISHPALPNPDWEKDDFDNCAKFCGWSVTDNEGNVVVFNGEHTITYNPTDGNGGIISITDSQNDVSDLQLDATHGVTLTAQWQFGYTAQAQTLTDSLAKTYENTALGGWVEETFIDDRTNNVYDYTEDINGDTRVERTDAYGAVGEKIIFKATADSANNYVFEGWYTITDGVATLISTSPNLAITVEEGKSTTYYARFKTKTVPVIFHYSESGYSDGYDYYFKSDDYKYGRYFQNVVYDTTAKKPPTNLTPAVSMWFTSPTERDSDHLFNFSTKITEETHLYASPAFTFNYYNYFKFAEPWYINTYSTLKFDGQYIDLKNDTDVSDYNVYILKGTLGESTPSASSIISNSQTVKTGKNIKSENVLFNPLTNTGQTFYRAGTSFNNFYLFNMKTPVWVVFDYTYRGIKYTSSVKDRSLYNDIDVYMTTEKSKYFTTFPPETEAELRAAQTALLESIKAMYDVAAKSGITEPSEYHDGKSVSGLTYDSTTDGRYTFSSTTAIRNIEPWGLKYTFSVNENTVTDFADYGAVVFTDKDGSFDGKTVTVKDLLDNENSVMYSKSGGNYYANDNGEIEIYYVNKLLATDFSKNTYVVFFVKDSDGNYCYSNVISNSYDKLTQADTSEISQSIKSYAEALAHYKTMIETAEYNKAQGYE